MNKKKVAILISHSIPYQVPLFRKLAENPKIDLSVYYCWDFGADKKYYDVEFGKKIKWDVPLLEGYKYKFLKNFSLKPSSGFFGQINFGIINELIKSKYDFILVFGWNSFANWLAFVTAFILKIPVVFRGENPLNQELSKPKWKLVIKKFILGWLFKHISTFLYIGEENKKFYKYYGVPENKLIFAPYAIDNAHFMEAGKSLVTGRESLRKKIGISENDFVILFVGKLIGKKRPMDLLKAYRQLITDNQKPITKTHLLFVGDGILRKDLEKYAKGNNLSNVHFLGFKNQTELPEYYVMSDIFVLPSGEGETWGLVVNEAMCFGLPIIVSSRVGCGPNLIIQGENGYIFPIGDVSKLADYLKDIFYNLKKGKLFGEKSFEIIKEYNYENDIKGIVKAFGLL